MKNQRYKFFRIQTIVLIAPFILMGPVIFTGKAIYWGTPLLQFVPWWTQAWQTLRIGQLPLWNSLLGMGVPLLANYQSALLYPPTWLYFLFAEIAGPPGIAWGQALLIALHLAWAGWGMVCLTRKMGWPPLAQTVSALAFPLSGYLVARSHFLSINAAVAWLPWILLGAYQLVQQPDKKRPALLLTGLIAMQLLAGHAQTTWYTLLLAAAWVTYWAWQKGGWSVTLQAWVRYVFAGGWAAVLAAAQLLPTVEYLLQSQRASAYDISQAMTYSFWPWRFLTLFLPNLFGSPANGDYWGYAAYWEDAAYVGLLAILMAIVILFRRHKGIQEKRFVRFLLIILGISFIFALGDNTPVFPWLYRTIPTFDMFQAPSRYLIWAVFALAMLAGMGIAIWRRPEGRGLYWARLATMGAFAVTLAAGIGYWAMMQEFFDLGEVKASFIPAFGLAGLVGLGIGVLNLLAPRKNDAKAKPVWLWAVSLLLTMDLILAGWGLNPGVDVSEYQLMSGTASSALVQKSRYHLSLADEQTLKFDRFLTFESFEVSGGIGELRNALLPNTNILDDLPMTSNFDPILPGRYTAWMTALDQVSPEIKAEMLARMGVDVEVQVEAFPPYSVSYLQIDANYGQLRWASCGIPVPDGETSLTMILNGEVFGAEKVLLETTDEVICGEDSQAELLWMRSANSVSIMVDTDSDGYLVLADTWYPGWQAKIDGENTEIYRADYLFRAIKVPAGNHQIEFAYLPYSFYIGVLMSVIGWGIWTYAYRKQKSVEK